MRKRYRILLIPISVIPIAISVFFMRFEMLAINLENQGVDWQKANGIKHAYAAAQTYRLLRGFYIGEDVAEDMVLLLGKANEYTEQVVKFRYPDSTSEIMKDLHNNQVGITAARWYITYEPTQPIMDYIITLADEGALINEVEVQNVKGAPASERDVKAAIHGACETRVATIKKVNAILAR